jgi:hypothetical protein
MLSNKKLVRYFKTSYAPDEMLIPTIVFNSTYSINAIAVKERSFSKLTPLHYLRYTNHIWVYDESSYTNIMNSGKIFVRKLVSGKSEKLIEMINKSIL